MNDSHEWFAPKRYGIGAGLPLSWQGWLVTILFMATVLGTAYTFEDRPLVVLAIILPLVVATLVVAARTTRGGWRWRWGERD